MGTNVGSAYVTLMPSMSGFASAVSSGMSSAFASASSAGGSAGDEAGSGFSTRFSAKMGAVSGIASSAFSKVSSAVTGSLDSAISRVDTLNQFPKVMQQMGFSADEAKASISTLSSGIEGLPTSLDTIAGSTQSIALLTGDLSGATDTALALNNAFLASGSSTADAERGLTQYTQMLSKGSVDLQSWRTLQETMGYALRETAEAMGFTGDSAVNDLYSALQSGEVTFDQFNDKLVECNQAQGGFADTAGTASSGIETSMANMQTAIVRNLADIIDTINQSGAIQGFFDGMKNAIDGIGDVLGDPTALTALSALTGGLVAFKAAMAISDAIGGAKAAMEAFKTAQEASTMAQAALNAVMSLNPFVLIATLIAAVVAALVVLYNTNEDFRNAVNQAWQAISETASAVFGAICDFFTKTIPEAFGSFVETVTTGWESFWSGLEDFCKLIWDGITGVVSGAIEGVKGIVTGVCDAIKGAWDAAWNAIKGVAETVWSAIKGTVSGAIEGVKGVIDSVLGAIRNIWEGAWDAVSGFLGDAWDAISGGVSDGIDGVLRFFQDLPGNILGALGNLGSLLFDSGQSLLQGLLDGIQGAVSWVTDGIGGVVETIRGFFPFSPAKEGPFSGHGYTTYSGKALMTDFAKGILSQEGMVKAATADALGVAQAGLTADLTTARSLSVSTGSKAQAYDARLDRIAATLDGILSKDSNVYMDSTKVSAALNRNAKYATMGAGGAW